MGEAGMTVDTDHLSGLTHAIAEFSAGMTFDRLDADNIRLARRCLLDGLGVSLAGSQQPGMEPLMSYIRSAGGTGQARLLGSSGPGLPAPAAALWMGTAGHAMDWDDTQLAEGPGRPYGLLMHPTMPPLTGALMTAELIRGETGTPVDGRRFLTAFATGFEACCKIAEAIIPDHYMRGFHTSGTIGTFGAAVAAANLLGLDTARTATAIGIAASSASGIRANFGSMTKPLHVGRAGQNGIVAALLARAGFSANDEALDGRWGYLAIAGPGGDPANVRDRIGAPFTMVTPGVSIKPYPSGVLTHPSMDALRFLMAESGLTPDMIESVELAAGSNVLGPIRFQRAMTELQGKFSFQFLLAAIVLRGKAGKAEFTDAFVSSSECQDMQGRITTRFDPEVEAMGWDKIRSRLTVRTRDGRVIERWADERYRGGPDHPLTDSELEEKVRDCAEGLLDDARLAALFEHVWAAETLSDVGVLLDDLVWMDR